MIKKRKMRVSRATPKRPIAKVQPYNFQIGTTKPRKIEGHIVQVMGGYLGATGNVVAYVQNACLFEGENRIANAAAFARGHGYRIVT